MEDDLARRLWDEAPDALIATTSDGTVLFWNRAAAAIFGIPPADALGRVIEELVGPANLIQEERERRRKVLVEGSMLYETVRRRADGSLVHVSVSSKAVTSGGEHVVLYTKKDVTALKVQRDTKVAAARFGPLLESMPDAILIVNITGRIVLINTQAALLFGYNSQDVVGRPVESLMPERFRSMHNSHRSTFLAQPCTRTMGLGLELFGLRKNGEEFPVEISLSPIETDEGSMVMSAVRDITDRKKAERKFRGLLESAPDAMVIVAQDGRISLVNSQAERLFGYRREELLGQPIEMIVPARYREKHGAHRGAFFRQRRARAMGAGLQLHGLRRDGTEFPVEISLSPLETEEGMFVSSAIRDATERRRFEQTLQQANRMKSEFLANMSHELRTPLNGIIGFSELLVDQKVGALNEKQREFLQDILSSGQHLLQLINDVLDLSKVEAGRMELVLQSFRLAEAVDEACAVTSPLGQSKGITLVKKTAASIDCVTLDRQKFVQVLYNLLSNALKFTPHGGQVCVETDLHEQDRLRLRVHDTGIGIKPSDLSKLFVEFQQIDSGTARLYEGTGLGLALTKRLVEFQGGSITVSSTASAGSTFTVMLPLGVQQNVSSQCDLP